MEKSLTQLQTEAVQEMHEPRTSAKRHAKHRLAVMLRYRRTMLNRGYSIEEVAKQVTDMVDMWRLENNAIEEESE